MRVDCFPDAPQEWPRKTVGEIAEIDPAYELEVGKSYPFVEMASVREGFGGISRFETRIWDRSGLCRFAEGDVMIGKITPCAENGKAALVQGLPEGEEVGIGSTEFFVLSPSDEVMPEFLFAAVTAGSFHRRLVSRMEGSTGRLRITRDTLKKWLSIALPPPDEQRRITAALKVADAAMGKAQAELQATLVLKRSLLNTLFGTGLPGVHSSFQETKIGSIPCGWTARSIRSVLAEKPDSGTSPLSRPDPPGTPILNVSCVKDGVCSAAEVTYVDVTGEEISRYRTQAGDFFVLRGNGNRDLVGTGGLLRTTPEVDTIYSDKLIRLRFNAAEVADRFVPYLWQSKGFLARLQSKAESGSGLWMMSKRDICRELFACPPMDEQQEIVKLLDSTESQINAHADKVEALIEVKRSLLQNLLTGRIRIPEGAIHA
jgi:type I restriction enzyme S subunit